MERTFVVLGDGTYVELDAEALVVVTTEEFADNIMDDFPLPDDCTEWDEEGVISHSHIEDMLVAWNKGHDHV